VDRCFGWRIAASLRTSSVSWARWSSGWPTPRRRVCNQRLVAALSGERLEVLDDGDVEHDVDALLADPRTHCRLPVPDLYGVVV
jgi:hypothetical protein